MYSLCIYIYMFCVNVAALFGNKKARLMMRGHRDTWRILREKAGDEQYVWFHAASLGEFEQGRPLMERLRREHPQKRILLTFFSPSGYEVRKDYDVADIVCYLPFDTAANVRKFFRLVGIEKAFFIKYEFWKNYLSRLKREGVETYSVSSIFRKDQVFFKWYARRYANVLRCFTHLFVQDENSHTLLRGIGVENVSVVGDTRFARVLDIRNAAKDVPIAEAFASGRSVLVCGSTWPPDEDLILDYFNRHKELRVILAPHVIDEAHLQNIESKIKRSSVRYTQTDAAAASEADCLIIDCFRLLSSLYRYGQVAYVGGGFGVGIHNVPEAAVYGVPVIIGPNNKKFREAQALLQNGGCREVNNQAEFDAAMDLFLTDADALKKAGDAAGKYVRDNADAADKIYDAVLK